MSLSTLSYVPKDAVALLTKLGELAKTPAIPASRTYLHAHLKSFLDRSSRLKLFSVLKYTAYIVLLLNAGSLPFVWHIRVLWPIIVARLDYLMLRLKLVFASKKERTRALIAWGEDLSPVGANPFEIKPVYRRWSTIDDIDMMGFHLSNSSYAKAFDSARAKALIKCFPAWGRSGGQMALGATHYHFLREIPPFVRYEVRLTIGSWDHKWLYVVGRYVTRPGRRPTAHRSPQSSGPSTPNDTSASIQNGSADVAHAVTAVIHTDSNGTGSTPRVPIVEPDGAILHCVAVSQVCFKMGRITIPPAVVLASDGFTKPYGDGESDDASTCSYSRANPPPNWIKSQSLRVPPHGSMDNFRDFLRSKWRDVPADQRWWEDALSGSIEARRQANLEILDTLKLGLERTRTLP